MNHYLDVAQAHNTDYFIEELMRFGIYSILSFEPLFDFVFWSLHETGLLYRVLFQNNDFLRRGF